MAFGIDTNTRLKESATYLKKLSVYAKTERAGLLTLLTIAIVQAIIVSATPCLAKPLIDEGIAGKAPLVMIAVGLIGFFIYIINVIVDFVCALSTQKIKNSVLLRAGGAYSKALFGLSLSAFRQRNVGSHLYALVADPERVTDVIVDRIKEVIVDIVQLIFYFALALFLSKGFGALVLLLAPLYILKIRIFQTRIAAKQDKLITVYQSASEQNVDSLSKMEAIKVFGAEALECSRFMQSLDQKTKALFSLEKLGKINAITSDLLGKAMLGVVGIYGFMLVQRTILTLGDLSAFLVYLGLFASKMSSMTYLVEIFFSSDMLHIKRFFDVVAAAERAPDPSKSVSPATIHGAVEAQHIRFAFERDTAVLEDSTITVCAGTWVGIIGASGCGKTTLAKIMLRLYDPDAGEMLIDGLAVQKMAVRSLRDSMCMVGQDTMLFNETILYNILYGTKALTEVDAVRACKTAAIYDDIVKLPHGFNTTVGDNAFRLSQGQKQRISLARAIVRRPKVLVLDEALSNVDLDTEELIYKALKADRANMTTIIISHRPSTFDVVDVAYEMKALGRLTKRQA